MNIVFVGPFTGTEDTANAPPSARVTTTLPEIDGAFVDKPSAGVNHVTRRFAEAHVPPLVDAMHSSHGWYCTAQCRAEIETAACDAFAQPAVKVNIDPASVGSVTGVLLPATAICELPYDDVSGTDLPVSPPSVVRARITNCTVSPASNTSPLAGRSNETFSD